MDSSWAVTKSLEVDTPLGQVSLTERVWDEPIDIKVDPESYWLELQLLPTTADGKACFTDQWRSDRFEPIGRAYLLPMSQTVRLKSTCRKNFAISCSFLPSAIQHWFDDGLEWTETRLKQGLNITNPTIRNLLFRMSEEIRTPSLGSDALVELIFAETIIELARYCLGTEERPDKGGLAAWRMRLIKERLDEPGARVSLTELATLCNMSPRQLTRAFRTTNGCSIGDYIAQDRIDKAKRLLKTDQNVKSIVHALGFNSPSHFYVAFHRATGETPLQYRQRVARTERLIAIETV